MVALVCGQQAAKRTYVYMYIYMYTHAYIRIYILIYIEREIHIHIRIYMYTYTYTPMRHVTIISEFRHERWGAGVETHFQEIS